MSKTIGDNVDCHMTKRRRLSRVVVRCERGAPHCEPSLGTWIPLGL